MAILYGTTGDGTTLPVLVDQFGNLLAKGIDGPPGPPGPPGVGQLPPDPYEGAILGWQDGELAWLGGSVPLPAGTYGPYTYIDGDERLDIPQDASSLVNGQQLYMSDFYGDEISVKYQTDTIANVNGNVLTFRTPKDFDKFEVGEEVQQGVNITAIDDTVPSITVDGGSWYGADDGSGDAGDGRYEPSQEWSSLCKFESGTDPYTNCFDGDLTTVGSCTPGQKWTLELPSAINYSTIRIYAETGGFYGVCWLDGVEVYNDQSGSGNRYFDITNTPGSVQKIEWARVDFASQGSGLIALEIDGKLLVDTSVPGGRGDTDISKVFSGSGSVFLGTNGAILLRANNGEWVDDFYVTAPEQRIAARKVSSNVIKRKKK